MFKLHYAPDNASVIIRMVLDEMALPFTTEFVDRNNLAQKSAAYRAINPQGLIPALETPAGPMFETAAILLWLADHTGKMAPAPNDPDRGLFLSWLFACSNGLHTDLRQIFYGETYAPNDVEGHRVTTQNRVIASLDRLEVLATEKHRWFAGASPSILDFYVATMVRWLALYPIGHTAWFSLHNWSELHKICTTIETRPSLRAASIAEGLGTHPLTAPQLPISVSQTTA